MGVWPDHQISIFILNIYCRFKAFMVSEIISTEQGNLRIWLNWACCVGGYFDE